MTMQPYGGGNPIELRKQEVRKNARNAALCVAGGVGGGVVLALLSSWFFLVLGLVVAVGGGGYYWLKVRQGIDPHNGVGY